MKSKDYGPVQHSSFAIHHSKRRTYPQYKPSGIEWLGEIPEHWDILAFKQLGSFQAGAGFPYEEQGISDDELPFYKVADTNLQGNETFMRVHNNTVSRETALRLRAFIFPQDTIVFAKVGAALLLNKRRILTRPSCIDNNMMGFTPKACDRNWAYYWMCSIDFGYLANPGAVPSINEGQVREIQVLVPPLDEQRTIAVFLDREMARIDGLIEKKQRQIELLQEKRSALISHSVTKGLDPNAKMKDSGIEWLGEIPEHWEVKPAKAILARNDSGVWGEDFDDDGVVILRSTEQTIDGEWNIIEPAKRRLSSSEFLFCRLQEGDLVVTKSSGSSLHIGKTSIVTQEVESLYCCCSNFMQRLRVIQHIVPRFIWYILNGEVGRKQFCYYSNTTTGLANLSRSIIGNIAIAVPSTDEQQAIAAFLDRETAKIDSLIEKVETSIDLLQEYRTALIAAAVTGKIDVRDVVFQKTKNMQHKTL